MASLPLFQSKDKDFMLMQTRWKSILDPVVANAGGAVGEVRAAYLTEPQFQAQYGTGWVLCDGRNVMGSAYALITGNQNIPDGRGCVLKMMNNNSGRDPAGNVALGTYQADQLGSHTHTITDPGHSHVVPTVYDNAVGTPPNIVINDFGRPGVSPQTPSTNSATTGITVNSAGTGETRGKSSVCNLFIRVN